MHASSIYLPQHAPRFRVFAVPSAAVRCAGLSLAHHLAGAAAKHALAWTAAVSPADATCSRKSGAAFLLAHFPAATAVLFAPASGLDGSGALVERAGPKCTMFVAEPPSFSDDAAAFHRARHCPAVVLRALPSNRDGVVDARVQSAVSIGAVLDADKLAEDLRGVAVWIGAGQLHRVLEAQSTFLHRGGGATFSKALA